MSLAGNSRRFAWEKNGSPPKYQRMALCLSRRCRTQPVKKMYYTVNPTSCFGPEDKKYIHSFLSDGGQQWEKYVWTAVPAGLFMPEQICLANFLLIADRAAVSNGRRRQKAPDVLFTADSRERFDSLALRVPEKLTRCKTLYWQQDQPECFVVEFSIDISTIIAIM